MTFTSKRYVCLIKDSRKLIPILLSSINDKFIIIIEVKDLRNNDLIVTFLTPHTLAEERIKKFKVMNI